MGKDYFDVYTPSHLVGGIILQRMRFTLLEANILHLVFEIYENTIGWRCFNLSPLLKVKDCKTKPDTYQNIIVDQLSFFLGFKIAEKIPKENLPYLPKYSLLLLPIIPFLLSLITTNIIGYVPKYEVK